MTELTGVRASDDERRDIADLLQKHYTCGRLTVTELDERMSAAFSATTRDQLTALMVDLPADEDESDEGTLDLRLLCLLLWLCPPAGLVYWLCARRG